MEGEGFDAPFDWRDALRFEGGWDYSFIKYLFKMYRLSTIKPISLVSNTTEEIRAAANSDSIVIYVPVNTRIRLNVNVQDYEFTTIDLPNRRFAGTELTHSGEQSVIEMHRFEQDVLMIGTRKANK
ncbi:hypothetical protein D3C73_1253830 [compost metagenome]